MSSQKYEPRDGDAVLPLFGLQNKTAIVTGAGAGIGFAVAEAFAEAGASHVAIWFNSNKQAHEKAADIEKRFPNTKCKAYQVNVLSQEEIKNATNDIVQNFFGGRLDIFIANAGIPWTKGAILDAGDEGVRTFAIH